MGVTISKVVTAFQIGTYARWEHQSTVSLMLVGTLPVTWVCTVQFVNSGRRRVFVVKIGRIQCGQQSVWSRPGAFDGLTAKYDILDWPSEHDYQSDDFEVGKVIKG